MVTALVGHINEVALRWARLVFGWVTVGVQLPITEIYLGLTNHGMSIGDGLLATTREETASSA